jgi:hypothetical protein
MGLRFNAPCEGQGELAGDVDDPRLLAIVARRDELVAALDQSFGDAPVGTATESFEEGSGNTGELDQLLENMVPFYDDGTTPRSTRALAAIANRLAEQGDSRAQATRSKLAELSTRQGYRAPADMLAATTPLLAYPDIDNVAERLLGLLGEGGEGNETFLNLLAAGALELADDSSNVANEDSSLRVAAQLLMRPLPAVGTERPADAGDEWTPPVYAEDSATAPKYFVRRDESGAALGGDGSTTPFPVAGRTDEAAAMREPDGRHPAFQYGNATETLLASLLREQHALLKRVEPGSPTTLEKLLRGVSPLLGPSGERTYQFNSGKQLSFQGPDTQQSPLLDLVHALAVLLTYPETESVLALLVELLEKYESDATGTMYLALAMDADADADPNVGLVGWDGTRDTRSEFWDDLIDVGMRMLEPGREGQLEAVLRSFGELSSIPQTSLLGKFMAYKDQVTYNGAPLAPAADGAFSEADKKTLNSDITTQLSVPVDRTEPDVGMNRSLFQRMISTIHATNGVPVCNKDGGTLVVSGPVGPLTFPNADPFQMLIANCAADSTHAGRASGYDACKFISQLNAAVTQMLSILGKGENRINDAQLKCAAAFNSQDIGATQEQSSQIDGFTLTPTPESLSRFIMAPRNKFMTSLFEPQPTRQGPALSAFEPDLLFALEPRQADVLLDGQPTNFLEVSKNLLKAFDDHEIVINDGKTFDQPSYPRGYMFAELMSALHMHWPSPRGEQCAAEVTPGNEGCSQRLDPGSAFYAAQSNLVSYEPVLIAAIQQHDLGATLYSATSRLKSIWVAPDALGRPSIVPAGTAGARDGIGVLADFLKRVLSPTPGLADRNGNEATHTNTCVPMTAVDPDTQQQITSCADGRGRVLEQTTPLYLLLDALARFDDVWREPANSQRHADWLEGRSELIDQLLSVDRDDSDPEQPVYRMRDQRGRAIAIELLGWLRNKVLTELHPLSGDRIDWAIGSRGLAQRVGDLLAHPLTGFAAELFDVVWNDRDAGDALADMASYLLDHEQNEDTFLGLALAAADTLEFVDHEPDVTSVVQFASLALAPNALEAIGSDELPDAKRGAAYAGLELMRKVAQLPAYRDKPELSTLSKLLKNASVAAPDSSRAPLQVFVDAVADINREDPTEDTAVPHQAADFLQVFANLDGFLSDDERGLERVYSVIANRHLNAAPETKP